MATAKRSDEARFAFLQSHPTFRDSPVWIAGAVDTPDGHLGEADAAEEPLVEEMAVGRGGVASFGAAAGRGVGARLARPG